MGSYDQRRQSGIFRVWVGAQSAHWSRHTGVGARTQDRKYFGLVSRKCKRICIWSFQMRNVLDFDSLDQNHLDSIRTQDRKYLHSDRLDQNPLDSTLPNAKSLGSDWNNHSHCNFSIYEEAGVLSKTWNWLSDFGVTTNCTAILASTGRLASWAKPVYYHNNDINTTKLNDI
jgi:hypothetical protein